MLWVGGVLRMRAQVVQFRSDAHRVLPILLMPNDTEVKMKRCAQCNSLMPDDEVRCIRCGAGGVALSPVAKMKRCTQCNSRMPGDEMHCIRCGAGAVENSLILGQKHVPPPQPCPKCGRIRMATESGPDWQCAKCGVAPSKAQAARGAAVGADMSLSDRNYLRRQSLALHTQEDADADKPSLKTVLFLISGRVPRFVFWIYPIVLVFFVALLVMLAGLLAGLLGGGANTLDTVEEGAITFLSLALSLPVAWSTFVIHVKRCHDLDKSGWFLLWNLVPIIGGLWVIFNLGFLRGTEGHNEFGPDVRELF